MLEGIEDLHPLSPLQSGILFQCLAVPDRPELYFNQCQLDIASRLDSSILQRAWDATVERHPALRSYFVWEGLEEPVQVVEKGARVAVTEHHLGHLPPSEQIVAMECEVEQWRQQGFELDRAPLMRIDVFVLGDDRSRIVWSFHHLLLDGWSAHLALDEVLRNYDELLRGVGIQTSSPAPYRDYIRWLRTQDPAIARTYWRSLLADWRPVRLPFIAGRSESIPTPVARQIAELALTDGELAQLTRAAARLRVTPSTLVQLAWGLLLGRHNNSRDVVFGTVVAGRPPEIPGCADMVGLFINTLPVRLNWQQGDRLSDVAPGLRDQLGRLQDLSASSLADIRSWCGGGSGSALVDHLILFENYRKDRSIPEMSQALRIDNVEWFECAGFPMVLMALPAEDKLILRLLFDGSRLVRTGADELLGQYAEALRGLIDGADPEIDRLSLVARSDPRRGVDPRVTTQPEVTDSRTIDELFRDIARDRPNAVALVAGERVVTYADLDAMSDAIAVALRARGSRPGASIGLCMERGTEAVAAMLGVLKAGCAYVPLEPSDPQQRLETMLRRAAVSLVIADDTYVSRLPEGIERLSVREIGEEAENHSHRTVDTFSEMTAYVMFTSGSVGEPKGVAVPHRAVVRLVRDTSYIPFGPEQVFLLLAPLGFDASTFEIWGPLLNGAKVVIYPEPVPTAAGLESVIREYGITVCWLTAGLFHQFLADRPGCLADLPWVLAGGDVVQPEAVQRLLALPGNRTFVNGYGPTENTTFSCCFPVRDSDAIVETVPIGPPIAKTTCYVLDADYQPVPTGVAGELFVGGDGVAHGYVGCSDLTAERFVPDPFRGQAGARMYRTGDRVRERPGGDLEFLGRLDRQVKIRGHRIEPSEIEMTLLRHPAVAQAAVAVTEDPHVGRRLVAYWVPCSDGVDPNELQGFLADRLPATMMPSATVRLEGLPLTRNGKVDYSRLPLVAPEPAREISTGAAFVTDTELRVAEIWRLTLGRTDVRPDENFFDAGGHSLLLLRVHEQMETLAERKIPLVDLFRFTTIRSQARYLEGRSESPLAADGGRAPGIARRLTRLAERRRGKTRETDG